MPPSSTPRAYAGSWLAYRTVRDRVPGIQAAVLFGDEVVHASAHGVADVDTGTPLTVEHRFRVASHSKTFTATAVVQLAEQGRLRLDDTRRRPPPRARRRPDRSRSRCASCSPTAAA